MGGRPAGRRTALDDGGVERARGRRQRRATTDVLPEPDVPYPPPQEERVSTPPPPPSPLPPPPPPAPFGTPPPYAEGPAWHPPTARYLPRVWGWLACSAPCWPRSACSGCRGARTRPSWTSAAMRVTSAPTGSTTRSSTSTPRASASCCSRSPRCSCSGVPSAPRTSGGNSYARVVGAVVAGTATVLHAILVARINSFAPPSSSLARARRLPAGVARDGPRRPARLLGIRPTG